MTRAITMMFFLVNLLGRRPAQSGAPTRPTQDPVLSKASDAYLAALLAGDAAAVAALYREDGIEMPPGVAPIVGRAAIEKYYRDLFYGPVTIAAFTVAHMETMVAGDVAYDIGTYKQTLSRGAEGSIDDSGKYVVILNRARGAWRASYVIYNSDQPPITPPTSASR